MSGTAKPPTQQELGHTGCKSSISQNGFTCCSTTDLLLESKASTGDQTGRRTRKEGCFGNGLEVSELEGGSSKIMLSWAVD